MTTRPRRNRGVFNTLAMIAVVVQVFDAMLVRDQPVEALLWLIVACLLDISGVLRHIRTAAEGDDA